MNDNLPRRRDRGVQLIWGLAIPLLGLVGLLGYIGLLGPVSPVLAAEALRQESTLGPVTAVVSVEPEAPVIGDAIELTLQVTAEEGVELLMPDFKDGLERFLVLGFAPRESVDADGRTVFIQRYTLRPPHSGEQSIPPLLIEFVDRREGQKPAPDGEDAYELLTTRVDFEVQSVLPDDADADLAPPLGTLAPREKPVPPRWPWIVGGTVIVLAASPFAVALFLRWRRLARRRSAYDVARARLDRLLSAPRPEGEALDPFFVELSFIVRQYLEDRFDLRAPELTTEEFIETVSQSPDISRVHQSLLRGFLRQADLVKFAHTVPGAEVVDESITASRQFLEETRENAPLIDAEEFDAEEFDAEELPGRNEGAHV